MDKAEQIRRGLRDLMNPTGGSGKYQTMLAQVVSVDQAAGTCVVDDDGTQITDVQLRPVVNNKESVTIYPKVGCYVLAIGIENTNFWMVVAADEMDKFTAKIGNNQMLMDSGKIKLTSGTQIIEMDGDKYAISKGAEDLKKLMSDLLDGILAMKFTTNTGVTINLVNALTFSDIKTRFNAFLKSL